MERQEDGRAYNQGRPKISELEKMRRAVKRQDLRYREMKKELRELGYEQPPDAPKKGRPRKLRQEKVYSELLKLKHMMQELRREETAQGEPHKPLHEIRDPLIENKTLHAVGRRPADELTTLDYEIRQRISLVFDLIHEVDQGKSLLPPAPRKGPRPDYLSRIRYQQEKIREHLARMLVIENGMTDRERIERQIKLFYDKARQARKQAKIANTEAEKRYYTNLNLSTYEKIDQLKDHLHEIERQKDQYNIDLPAMKIKLDRPYDYDLARMHKEIHRMRTEYT